MNKSGLRQAGEIVTLIGSILETIFHSIIIMASLFIWTIPAAIFIPLCWVARSQATKRNSLGWMIYGIIQSVFFNWTSLAGYILLIIDHNNQNNNQNNDQNNNQNNDQVSSTM